MITKRMGRHHDTDLERKGFGRFVGTKFWSNKIPYKEFYLSETFTIIINIGKRTRKNYFLLNLYFVMGAHFCLRYSRGDFVKSKTHFLSSQERCLKVRR